VGKVASAVTFSVAVSWSSVLAAIAAAGATTRLGSLLLPRPEQLLWICGVALGYSLLTATLAAAISLHLAVARSAQQIAAMLSVVLAMLGSALLGDRAITWTTALAVPAVLVALATLATLLVMSTFRRDRLLGAS